MRLIVSPGKTFHVNGKHLQEGDDFDVPEDDAKRWVAFGLAYDPGRVPEPQKSVSRGRVRNRVMTNEQQSSAEESLAEEPGRYHRTDLRSED